MKRHAKDEVTCAIVGARGYAGLETARLLLRHPNAALTHCFATSRFELSKILNVHGASSVRSLPDSELMENLADVVFLATPAETSLELAPKILAAGKRVIDLSGAFRLKRHSYKEWYGFEHHAAEILANADYGLAPWAGPAQKKSRLIANPGCYATAISLALIPLVKAGLIELDSIVIDAKSGTTGAGKKAAEHMLYSEVDGECLPYKVGWHQHSPEIREAVAAFAGGTEIDFHLTTSLIPVRRGIIAGLYGRLADGIGANEVASAFAAAYGDYPLVSLGTVEAEPALLSLKKVVGTGRTHISFTSVGRKLYVFSCIDNLLKGAASQAVENFNRLSDLPLWTGVAELEAQI